MEIVVVGAGGVGGYFGGKLAQAGFDVTFLARGKHLEAIKQNGLQVKSINGDFIVFPKAVSDVKEIKTTPDLIILGVKSWQVIDVAKKIKPLIGKKMLVLPLQNGADNVDKLARVLPKENILAGLCRIVSKVETPGVINHFAYEPEIVFGGFNNRTTLRLKSIQMCFDKSGIKNQISKDVFLDIWRKFLFITMYSGIGALTQMPLGAFINAPFIKKIITDTASEILQIANKKQIGLTQKDIDKSMYILENLDYNTTASMQRDVMAGKPSELDNFNGYIVKQGLELGIKTPVNDFIYYCLLPQENKARKGI